MSRSRTRIFFTVVGLCLFSPGAPAQQLDPLDQWPNWRGPLVNGSSPRGNPPLKWDEQTNVRWKVRVPGKGSSTPAVWGERVFVLTAVKTDKKAADAELPKIDPKFIRKTNPPRHYYRFLVICYDRGTGKELWRHTAAEAVPHEGTQPTHSYAAASPVTDGKRVYASFGSFGVYCYDLEGKQLWKRDFGRMVTRLGWGEAYTPAVRGDALVLAFYQEAQSFAVCLDAATGETRWKKERDEPTNWSTPLIAELNGRAQVVVNGTNCSCGYDLKTGEVLWECGGQSLNAIPSPVRYGDAVICMSGYGKFAARAVPLDARGDLTKGKGVLWRLDRGTPYVPSPLLDGDLLYFTQGNTPLLTCVEAKTGKVLIDRERLKEIDEFYASPAAAAGRVYLTGRDGTTLVLKRGAKAEVLSVNRLEDSIDASPVIVGRQLLLRGHEYLYCLEEK